MTIFNKPVLLHRGFKPYLFLFTVVFVLLSACSTEKNRFINRVYHGLLARDNGYFHAKLRMEEGAQKLADMHEDKFDRILSVFQFADAKKAKEVYPLMDEAIKKVSTVIQRHAMMVKGEERNPWIDDNYLLMGQCQFYKHDFRTAAETFQYVAFQYKKNDIRHETLLWQIQTDLELAEYEEAESRIDYARNDKKFPKKLQGRLHILMADFYIRKKNYDKAIEFLKKGIPETKKRQSKTRYMYILAQLYQKQGNGPDATKYYLEVVKRNPVYEMAFNAQINLALNTDAASKNTKNVKKLLSKMLKDDKNIDFYDQIYYAMASIAIKENDTKAAIEYLELSIRSSKTNINQKALSFLELAKIYFNRPNYELAHNYYDSTTTYLSKDHPDYDIILSKKNSLTALVKNLRIIIYEDSLQKLAALSPAEREKAVETVLAKEAEERQRKKEEEEAKKALGNTILTSPTPQNASPAIADGTAWYFYNPATISFGYAEFLKKWGDRKLEDNWRRKNKESIMEVENPDGTAEDSTSTATAKNDTAQAGPKDDKNTYLSKIPTTDKQMEKSHNRIIEALNDLAYIYKENLQDYAEAAKTTENLLQRYPDNKYILKSYYNLYRIYLQLNNQPKADYYKNIILSKYADSEYAQIISNPNYLQDQEKKKSELDKFYEETYTLYSGKNYQEVITRKSQADSLFPANKLGARFDYLKTLSIGHTQDVESFEKALKYFIVKYPKDAAVDHAREILTSIKNKREGIVPVPPTGSNFKIKTDTVQYYVVAFSNNSIDLNTFKTRLTDYNVNFFRTMPLAVSDMFLDSTMQMVIVKSFEDKKQALDYFNSVKDSDDLFGDFLVQPQQFMITPENFVLFYKEKNIGRYLEFFQKNY